MRLETQRFDPLDALLWIAILLPPAAALGAQWLGYSLVHRSCEHQSKAALLAIAAAALAVCAASFAVARGVAVKLGHEPPPGDRRWERARFLANAAQIFAGFFFLVVAAMAVPGFVLRVCD